MGARRDRIVGGAPDTQRDAVVAVVDAKTAATCSGTVVAATLVVTAAHCVYGVEPGDLRVIVGSDVTAPSAGRTFAVSATATYPTYRGESEGISGGVDLAILRLANPVSVTPISVDLTTTDSDFQGALVTLVGYGASDGTDNSGVGARRSVVLPVEGVCSRLLTIGGADANACLGDSGGAVLLQGRLVGVISGGKLGCFAPSTLTRLDAHAGWMSEALAGNPSEPCSECVAPDFACDAPTETSARPDAGTEAAAVDAASWTVGGGGCSVGGPEAPASTAWILLGLAMAGASVAGGRTADPAALRRRGAAPASTARGSTSEHAKVS